MKSGVGINWVCFTLPIKNLNFINIFIKENILDILKVFKVNKKGASNVNANIDKLLSGVLLILFTVVLAPVIFGTDGLANAGFFFFGTASGLCFFSCVFIIMTYCFF